MESADAGETTWGLAYYPDLRNKVVVVTGASGGIGRALTRCFAAQGTRIVAVGRSATAVDDEVRALRKLDAEAIAIACDVTDEDEVKAMVETALGHFDVIDVLVNNAGTVQQRGTIVEMTLGEWNRVFAVNVTAAMLCMRHVMPHLTARGAGAVVNVSSLGAAIPRLAAGAYCASKAAVEQLTRVAAMEVAGSGVRVNAIAPGSTDTPMLRYGVARDGHATSDYRVKGDPSLFRSPIPLGRLATAEEQAWPIVFLASSAASFITGQVLTVDGGSGII